MDTKPSLPPIPAPGSKSERPLLECPLCHTCFVLTWPIYLSKLLNMRCPSCRQLSRFRQSWWTQLVATLITGLVMLTLILLVSAYCARNNLPNYARMLPGILFICGIALVAGFAVDKNYCAHLGTLHKRGKQ